MAHPPASAAFLRLPEVIRRTGLSRSTIYLRVNKGTFPAPLKIGIRAIAWLEAEIDAWLAATVKAARPARRRGPVAARGAAPNVVAERE